MPKSPTDTSGNLLLSFFREYGRSKSGVGKVWQVIVRDGMLSVGDRIRITSVKLLNEPRSQFVDIEATVKTIHRKAPHGEEAIAEESVGAGSIVGMDIKDCHYGRKKVSKKEIGITKHSIGFHGSEPYENCSDIGFVAADTTVDIVHQTLNVHTYHDEIAVRPGRGVMLLWFGKKIAARYNQVSWSPATEKHTIHLRLEDGRLVPVPKSKTLRDAMRNNVLMLIEHGGNKVMYYRGRLATSSQEVSSADSDIECHEAQAAGSRYNEHSICDNTLCTEVR
jgi:hypothetical protein